MVSLALRFHLRRIAPLAPRVTATTFGGSRKPTAPSATTAFRWCSNLFFLTDTRRSLWASKNSAATLAALRRSRTHHFFPIRQRRWRASGLRAETSGGGRNSHCVPGRNGSVRETKAVAERRPSKQTRSMCTSQHTSALLHPGPRLGFPAVSELLFFPG